MGCTGTYRLYGFGGIRVLECRVYIYGGFIATTTQNQMQIHMDN